ncbi:MAG TPA: hypothetical protein VFN56_04730 [Candidatus Saccharimonadales bacterium]|nr:hypothetical protein [Candidatus Saccharimonadales bacterium]
MPSSYEEAEFGSAQDFTASISDTEFAVGMRDIEREARRQAFQTVFSRLKSLNPHAARSILFVSYAEDILSRTVLLLRYNAPKHSPRANPYRVIVNDEKLQGYDLSQPVIAGTDYIVRPVGNLISVRSYVTGLDDVQNNADALRIIRPYGGDNITRVQCGSNYTTQMLSDAPVASFEDLQDRRIAAERMATLLKGLRHEDGAPTDVLFERVGM